MIDHDILLQKLSHYGVTNMELNFFRSYLHDRKQCSNVNEHSSTFGTIRCGVPQGSILDPLLFIIYMSDLPLCIENGHVTMYADDTSSSSCIKFTDDIISEVIPNMRSLMDWLRTNRLNLNKLKTEFMLSRTSANILKIGELLAIRIDGHTIKRVRKPEYLGIIIDEKLTWEHHIDYISLKIKRNTGILRRVKGDNPKRSLTLLYKTLVEPYLSYYNKTWGTCSSSSLDRLQALQNRAVRTVANFKYEGTDHAKLLKELDWLNVREIIEYDTASLVYKIENDLAPAHMKNMFMQSSEVHAYSTRSAASGDFHLANGNLNIGKASIFYHGAYIWNQLPVQIREAQSIKCFQNCLKETIGNI